MSKLLIVESPAKAKTITKYLGAGYDVEASMGHLRDLPRKELGVDVEHDFEVTYIPIEGKDKIIKKLKTAADKAEYHVAQSGKSGASETADHEKTAR